MAVDRVASVTMRPPQTRSTNMSLVTTDPAASTRVRRMPAVCWVSRSVSPPLRTVSSSKSSSVSAIETFMQSV